MTKIFEWPIRVYYEDTDAGGIVFYANYLKFFERARTEWLRAAGVNQSQMTDTHRVMFVVQNTAVAYHAPAKLDDELRLSVVVEKQARASVQFLQEARCGERLMATGTIKVVCVAIDTLRPSIIPAEVMSKINALSN